MKTLKLSGREKILLLSAALVLAVFVFCRCLWPLWQQAGQQKKAAHLAAELSSEADLLISLQDVTVRESQETVKELQKVKKVLKYDLQDGRLMYQLAALADDNKLQTLMFEVGELNQQDYYNSMDFHYILLGRCSAIMTFLEKAEALPETAEIIRLDCIDRNYTDIADILAGQEYLIFDRNAAAQLNSGSKTNASPDQARSGGQNNSQADREMVCDVLIRLYAVSGD